MPANRKENTGQDLHHKNELYKSIYMFNHHWKVATLLFGYIPRFTLRKCFKDKQNKTKECNNSL